MVQPIFTPTGGAIIPQGGAPGITGPAAPLTSTPSPTGPPTTPTPSPTIASLYGTESDEDKGLDSSVGVYKDIANTPVDEQSIRNATTQRLQTEIDATNAAYAEKLRQATIAGDGRLGQNAAISARRGLLGSDFGTQANDKVTADNQAVYGGIDQEKAAAVAGITDKGQQEATAEIAAKNAAKQAGATDYINFLTQADSRKSTRTTTAATHALTAGVDLTTLSPSDLQAVASSYNVSPDALISAFTNAKAAYKPTSITAGAPAYQFNPQTGAYEKVAGSGVSDAVSQAIADGRLDPSQVTRYNIQAISDTLGSDPTHDFITGKQTLQNSTSYTKDAFGNIVPVQRFPNVPVAGAGGGGGSSKAGLPAAGGGGGTTSFPKADAASLQQQQIYADSTQRAFNTANQNLQALIPFMNTAGVNTGSTVPLINSLQNRVKAGLADPGTIAGFNAALAGLRAEYAQVLSRGGEVTDGQRNAAATLIPDNLTPAQLQQVADRLNVEGTNAVKEAQTQIQTIKDRASGKTTLPAAGVSLKDPKTGEVRTFTGLSASDLKDALAKGYLQQ